MIPGPTAILKKFGFALRGIVHALTTEWHFQVQAVLGILLLIFGFAYELSEYEIFALLISYTLLAVAELLNTALETALNRLHPDEHHLIGAAKDVAAGAVLLALLLLVVIIFLILF